MNRSLASTLSGVALAALTLQLPAVLGAAEGQPGAAEVSHPAGQSGSALSSSSDLHAAPGNEALDYGFRFASAIRVDPKDMGRAQESVVLDYVAAGALDAATARVDRVEGWRRGVVQADLAAALARAGRSEEAHALLTRADAQRRATEGWQERRVAAHVAQAQALLGELEPSRALAAELAAGDAQQYTGLPAATLASARAAAGDYDGAMVSLRSLDAEKDPEAAGWRTQGYLTVARQKGLPAGGRLEALDAARRSAEELPGWRQAEALGSLAEEYRLAGRSVRARAVLEEAEEIARQLPATMPVKGPILSSLAGGWARLGQKERASGLLEQAEAVAPSAMLIDRPGIMADIAATRQLTGDETGARRLFAQALAGTEALANARPRALAAVEVCRSLARSRRPLDASTRTQLDALLLGLKEPW
jgi:hypothetical protein